MAFRSRNSLQRTKNLLQRSGQCYSIKEISHCCQVLKSKSTSNHLDKRIQYKNCAEMVDFVLIMVTIAMGFLSGFVAELNARMTDPFHMLGRGTLTYLNGHLQRASLSVKFT